MQVHHEANEDYKDVSVDSNFVEEVEEAIEEEDNSLYPEEVLTADAQIAAYHPLRYTPIEQIWPIMCCCMGCCRSKPEETEDDLLKKQAKIDEINNRQQRLKAMIKMFGGKYKGTKFQHDAKKLQGLLPPKKKVDEDGNEIELEEKPQGSPLKSLGLGIYVWTDMLSCLGSCFFLFAIIAAILCKINASGGSIVEMDAPLFSKAAWFSLGNIEGAQSFCYNQFMDANPSLMQNITCNKGTVSQLKYVGIIAAADSPNDKRYLDGNKRFSKYEGASEKERLFGYNYCGDPKLLTDEDNCDEMLDEEAYRKAFNLQCFGQ